MERHTIAVDCDDVIANINDDVRLFINETKGFAHTAEEYRVTGEYRRYWERIWGIADDQSVDWFDQYVASGRMAQLEPVPGALEALADLKQDYSLAIVTARSVKEVEFTEQWLATHAPDVFDHVTYVHRWQETLGSKPSKAAICQELGADYLIDDNYDHCRIAATMGKHALLFGDYGWNRDYPLQPNMTRVPDWSAVREYFTHAG